MHHPGLPILNGPGGRLKVFCWKQAISRSLLASEYVAELSLGLGGPGLHGYPPAKFGVWGFGLSGLVHWAT